MVALAIVVVAIPVVVVVFGANQNTRRFLRNRVVTGRPIVFRVSVLIVWSIECADDVCVKTYYAIPWQ